MQNHEHTLEYMNIKTKIPKLSKITKVLRKYQTIEFSPYSKGDLRFTFFISFLYYCIDASTPSENILKMIRNALRKCLIQNSTYLNKNSIYDSVFEAQLFKCCAGELSEFLSCLKVKLDSK